MIEPSQIDRMSVTERLKALEQLWEALRRDAGEIPSPTWHERVLAVRKELATTGDAKFLTLDELKDRVWKPDR